MFISSLLKTAGRVFGFEIMVVVLIVVVAVAFIVHKRDTKLEKDLEREYLNKR